MKAAIFAILSITYLAAAFPSRINSADASGLQINLPNVWSAVAVGAGYTDRVHVSHRDGVVAERTDFSFENKRNFFHKNDSYRESTRQETAS